MPTPPNPPASSDLNHFPLNKRYSVQIIRGPRGASLPSWADAASGSPDTAYLLSHYLALKINRPPPDTTYKIIVWLTLADAKAPLSFGQHFELDVPALVTSRNVGVSGDGSPKEAASHRLRDVVIGGEQYTIVTWKNQLRSPRIWEGRETKLGIEVIEERAPGQSEGGRYFSVMTKDGEEIRRSDDDNPHSSGIWLEDAEFNRLKGYLE